MRIGMGSPWGTVDYVEPCAPGITWVSTPGHGGVHLDAAHVVGMPDAFMGASTDRGGVWWEEDCSWSLVAIVYPYAFPRQSHHPEGYNPVAHAWETARRYFAAELDEARDVLPAEPATV